MRRFFTLATVVAILALLPASVLAQAAPAPATKYLSRFDVPTPPRDMEQVLVIIDIPPGGSTPMHMHGGAAYITVLEGEPTFQVKGGEPRRLTPGQTWVENAGELNDARNTGTTKARLGVTILLPKGATLTTNETAPTPGAPASFTAVHRVSLPVTNPPAPLEVAQFVVEFPTGSWTPWHTHGGQGFVLVTDGEATHEMSGMQHRYKVGETWIDRPDIVHRAGAQSGAPVKVFASFLLPKGATLTTPQPAQTGTAPGAAPAAAPTQLPRTGGLEPAALALFAAACGVGGWLLRRRPD